MGVEVQLLQDEVQFSGESMIRHSNLIYVLHQFFKDESQLTTF